MASSRSSVIQLNDEQDPHSELQFQDFSLGESSSGIATLSPTGTYNNFPDSPDSREAESDDLLGTEKKEESSFWKFSYYQSFFDIETVDFLERLKWSFIPVLGRATFLDRQIRPKPDLYGPFWITFCLIYSTAIMSNVAHYFNGTLHSKKEWAFNFHRVSLSATAIYAYVFLLPIILWGVLKKFQFSNRYTLLEIVCVYGYSLAIFVPISIFWIFDAAWLHWILVIIGIALTGAVLVQIFWPVFRDDDKKTGTILLCVILTCHILLGIGFGTLFFQERVEWVSTSTAVPDKTSVTPNLLATIGPKLSRSIGNSESKLNNLDITTIGLIIHDKTDKEHLNATEHSKNSVNKFQSHEKLGSFEEATNESSKKHDSSKKESHSVHKI